MGEQRIADSHVSPPEGGPNGKQPPRQGNGHKPPEVATELSPADRLSIRNQLERVLASSYFRSSKRYTNLLRYAVEHTLAGHTDRLKERSLGIEVFQREPDYDTGQDPVVRTSAVEIRKRLSQYYQQSGHEAELRIEFPAGSYVPEFHAAPQAPAAAPEAAVPEAAVQPEVGATAVRGQRVALYAVLAISLMAVAATAAYGLLAPAPAIDRFWAPLLRTDAPVLFGLAGGAITPVAPSSANPDATLAQLRLAQAPERAGGTAHEAATSQNASGGPSPNRFPSVPFGDVSGVVKMASWLQTKGKNSNVRLSNSLQMEDLKRGPAVLAGFTLTWLDMLTSNWRFTVLRDDSLSVTWINDRDKPGQKLWSKRFGVEPQPAQQETYALVTRVWPDSTNQPLINIAGLDTYATGAAGQFIADRAEMERWGGGLPKGWEKKNIQIVIGTKRIGTSTGQPRVMATHLW